MGPRPFLILIFDKEGPQMHCWDSWNNDSSPWQGVCGGAFWIVKRERFPSAFKRQEPGPLDVPNAWNPAPSKNCPVQPPQTPSTFQKYLQIFHLGKFLSSALLKLLIKHLNFIQKSCKNVTKMLSYIVCQTSETLHYC